MRVWARIANSKRTPALLPWHDGMQTLDSSASNVTRDTYVAHPGAYPIPTLNRSQTAPPPRFAHRRTPVTDRPPVTEESLSVTGLC
jgi:hypothetical protein